MKLEYRFPLSDPEWKPLKANTLMEAAKEVAGIIDIQVRNATTKEIIKLPAPYGYNAGVMCDTPPGDGPCSCGAHH